MATCSIDGCDGTVRARGWCQAHYMRWWTTGSAEGAPVVRRARGRTCSLEGCDRKHCGRGFCESHLRRFLQSGDPGPVEIKPRNPGAECRIEGCDKTSRNRGLCNAHDLRRRITGDPLTPRAEKVHWWTGDEATYVAVHIRLRSQRGKASAHSCARCGRPAQEWAYDHADPDERMSDKGQPYSLDLFGHYQPLCRPCHRKLDGPAKAKLH